MCEIVNTGVGALPHIPDDLTIPQFMLDSRHPARPVNQIKKPWLIEDATGREVYAEEIRTRTFGFANELHARWRICENDVVCIFSPNHVDYPVAVWGVHRLGGVVTTANPLYTTDELTYQLQMTQATVLITCSASISTAENSAKAAGISPERIVLLDSILKSSCYPTLDELVQQGLLKKQTPFQEIRLAPGEAKTRVALLIFSSGTTGRPKAVAIPHYAVIANVIQMAVFAKTDVINFQGQRPRYDPGQIIACILPFFHIAGLIVNMHFYVFCEFSLVVIPKFSLETFLRTIQRYKVNHLAIVPPTVVLLCKVTFVYQIRETSDHKRGTEIQSTLVKQYDLSSVTFVMSGAAPLSAELTQQLIRVLPQVSIGQIFGTTETCTTVAMPRLDQKIGTLGSSGQLLPGMTVRVMRSDGSLAGYNEPGELVVQGPSMALCYLHNEEATKETFVYFDGSPDRWVRTGDEVMFNKNCEMFVVDRIKEILKVRGFQVAPAELEGHLFSHPDVDDVCVVGIPDEYSGELPLAFVALTPAAAGRAKEPKQSEEIKASIIKFVADAKVYYKHLAGGVIFIDAIPKNPSGKLLRRFLRDKVKNLRVRKDSTGKGGH